MPIDDPKEAFLRELNSNSRKYESVKVTDQPAELPHDSVLGTWECALANGTINTYNVADIIERLIKTIRFLNASAKRVQEDENIEHVSISPKRKVEQPVNSPMELLKYLGYVNAMIGYCQSLRVGTAITEGYMQRMNAHYIPNAQKACLLIAGLVDKAQAPAREIGTQWKLIDDSAKQGETVIIAGYVHGEWTVMQDDWYEDRVMADWREWPGVMNGEPTHYMAMPTPPEPTTEIEGGKP